jgi:predicted Zn-ribbon and HTH transcriptional regulator
MEKEEVIRKLKCTRCGYEWFPRSLDRPVACPNVKCHSPYWNVPRKEKKGGDDENLQ